MARKGGSDRTQVCGRQYKVENGPYRGHGTPESRSSFYRSHLEAGCSTGRRLLFFHGSKIIVSDCILMCLANYPHMATSRLSTHYAFTKPNDIRALNLMNAAATHVVRTIPDLTIAYGVSDEYSFVFHRSTNLFERRSAKLVSTVVSTFTAAYVALWGREFGGAKGDGGAGELGMNLDLDMLPTFDGRAVCYPTWENLRDYLSWRQVDCMVPPLRSLVCRCHLQVLPIRHPTF